MMSMRNDGSLKLLNSSELAALKAQLEVAGSVMDFEVYSVSPGEAISWELHRQALVAFFESVREKFVQHRVVTIRDYPQHAGAKFFVLGVNCTEATATKLPQDRVLQLVVQREHQSDAQCLFGGFSDPPYPMKIGREEAQPLFERWCDLLGLRPEDSIEVLDWVGSPDQEPQRSEWSNYFDAGKEWWGIWCLTIWNPVERTIGVVAASTTD